MLIRLPNSCIHAFVRFKVELDKAKKLETFYTLDKAGIYTLTAKHSNFIGKYKIKIIKVD